MKNTDNKTALITGASSGLGSYLAHAFAAAGAALVAVGRDKKRLLALKKAIEKSGGRCAVVVADLQTEKGLEAVAKALKEHDVRTLINNAGIYSTQGSKTLSAHISDINSVLLTNTSAAIALCIAAHEHFTAHGGGSIVNINSAAGLKGNFAEALYCASKFGLRGFSESVKDHWLKDGVRMTDVYPGSIATGMASHRRDVDELIQPAELAELIVKLCETGSFYVRDMSVQRTLKRRQ